MTTPIKNNETIVASNKSVCLLLGGTITIEKGGKLVVIPSKSFFFYDESFDIVAASPFIEGFVSELDALFLTTYPDVKRDIENTIKPFEIFKIKDIDGTRNKIKMLLNTSNNKQLQYSYQHVLWFELINDYKAYQEKPTIIGQFSDLIEQNIEQNYCAGTYAEMMGIPLKSLIKEVKKTENKTPCNFITEKVIKKAKYKLKYSEDTSQMIAYQLGFEDPYYFIKYFKKNTELTPTQYRKQLKEMV